MLNELTLKTSALINVTLQHACTPAAAKMFVLCCFFKSLKQSTCSLFMNVLGPLCLRQVNLEIQIVKNEKLTKANKIVLKNQSNVLCYI